MPVSETTVSEALSARAPGLTAPLLRWYDSVRRDLPFRRTRDPYAIWVSEVMLQQTQVQTVLPYYERWMQRFPDVRALAAAEEAEVLHAFQGLGYYSRARSLLRAAREVVARFNGSLPSSAELLQSLPGIGAYSAGAIASIAYGERVPVVDGNVVRVLCRLFALHGDPARAPRKREIWCIARALVPASRPGDFNQALMELGATVCTPRAPNCDACPLRKQCDARRRGIAESLPELAPRPAIVAVPMVAVLLFRQERVATVQLPANAPRWAGMWQFPNVELEPGEDAVRALGRAARAAVGTDIAVEAARALTTVKHSVTRYRITLDVYSARVEGPLPAKPDSVRFRTVEELGSVAMPAAHRRIALLLSRGIGAGPA